MELRKQSALLLLAALALLLASGTQREHGVLTTTKAHFVTQLEAKYATDRNPDTLSRLAQGYLDVEAPGLALSVVEAAPAVMQRLPAVEHVYARALLDSGRAERALAAENRVLASCAARTLKEVECSPWLLASATRRASILRQLVDLGIEDAQAHPEASAVAYHNATRDARLAVR